MNNPKTLAEILLPLRSMDVYDKFQEVQSTTHNNLCVNTKGNRYYELANHLGNPDDKSGHSVLTVVGDRRLGSISVSLTDFVGVIEQADGTLKNINTTLAWKGAATTYLGQGDCYVEHTVLDANNNGALEENYRVMLGLSYNNTNTNYTSINYCFYTYHLNDKIHIYENGSDKGIFGTYHNGDKLRVSRQGTNIKYYINANLVRSVSESSPNSNMLADISMFEPNTYVYNLTYGGDNTHFAPDIVSASDYYPFGSQMVGRSFSTNQYRYGFGGQEKDDEVFNSTGTSYTAQFWQYDSRLGRRWNVDPFTYPWQSSYTAFNNNPIIFVDPLGLFGTRKEARKHKKENGLKGRIRKGDDGVYSIDNKKQGTSIFKDKEFGIQTAVLVTAKRPDNKNITPFEIGVEWLTGKGARERDFTDGDFITELYKKHEHIKETRNKIIKELQKSNGTITEGSNNYSLSGTEGVGKYIKDYSTLATGGATGNLIYTYLGSHSLTYKITSVDIKTRIATVTFTVHNRSTIQSATRPPVLGYTEWYQKNIGEPLNNALENGPMSETSQSIEWTEKIKF